ncbi:hypothetical protein WHR41_02739 [Cladosporium halotolerans]|uniref:Amino acid permease/ SLC12A domain-containing protein n=1 Tax=Cladosporium halotolerans TaxID=1052096 RepID=A0AB34KYZ3_9PEZI
MANQEDFKHNEIVTDTPQVETGNVASVSAVKRKLSARHVQLMAVAGAIGIGLFVGIGGVLAKAGPIALTLGYMFYGLCFIWPLTLHVGEMCAWLPIRGSLFGLATRLVDPALGFAMGIDLES